MMCPKISEQEAQMRQRTKQIHEKAVKEFDRVVAEFARGDLLAKINEAGTCEYIFTRGGIKRKCERELNHKGAHMFGISKSLYRSDD